MLVVDGATKRSGLNEETEVGCLRQLVNEGLRASRVLVSSEFAVVEKVFAGCVVVHRLRRVHPRVDDVPFVVLHYARHEFEEGVADSDGIDLPVEFVGVDHNSHESIVNHLQVGVGPLTDAVRSLHHLFFKDAEVALRELARVRSQLACLDVAVVEVDNRDVLWHLDDLVVDGFVKDLGLDTDQEREGGVDHVHHVDGQDRDQGVVPAQREDQRAKGHGSLREECLVA